MNKYINSVAVVGIFAVAIGAFGAHGIEPHLDAKQIATFKTASMYHYLHLLAMMVIAFHLKENDKVLKTSFWAFLIGIALFSGSLYLLSTKHLIGGEVWNFLGPITPLGGLVFIIGWANLIRYRPI